MATTQPAATNNKARPDDERATPVPPEERFWQHYSPHHEAPLAGVGSLTLHGLAFVLIALVGLLAYYLGIGNRAQSLPVEAVAFDAGGGGNPQGEGKGPADVPLNEAAKADGTATNPNPATAPEEAKVELKDPAVVRDRLPEDLQKDDNIQNIIAIGNENIKSFAGLDKEAQKKLRIADAPRAPGKGQGGTGSGGGKDKGTGTGTGTGAGEGTQRRGTMSQREKRMLRWTMEFNTQNGDDYLRQLQGLGAILAIPRGTRGGDYQLIRDLSRRPPQLLNEDVHKLQRIFWIDDKPMSVRNLILALGLNRMPSHFVAFMPPELEDKLFKLELDYRGLKEEDIYETRFRIRRTPHGYEPEVIDQRSK
jgi:hypothetical protein